MFNMQLFLLVVVLSISHAVSLTCEWSRKGGYRLNPFITSGRQKSVTARSEDECKQNCVEQTTFICSAINYRYDGLCKLLAENDDTASEQWNNRWIYAVRPSCAGVWQPWQAVKGQQPGDGVNIITGNYSTVRDCMSGCLQTSSGGCRSVVMDTGDRSGWSRCRLANKRSDDYGVNTIENSTYQIFNRPSWYLADSPGVTRTPMEDFRQGGAALHVLHNYKIPIDGYLVAWQYYMGHNYYPCTTYAVIWRREGNSYTRIAETKLTPEKIQSRGVRFQYVQDSNVVVRRGDLLGFYSDNGDSGCSGSLISFKGEHPEASLALVCGGNYDQPSTLPSTGSGCSEDRRVVALRAYIAGLTMISTPTSSHERSLSEGQIKITWESTQGSHDQTGSVYVKISCSTTSTFFNQVGCQSKLVPAESNQAVLTLPDITQPYYSRLYLMVLDEKVGRYQQRTGADEFYVNDGRLFCVERGELTDDQVNIGESGQLLPGEKRRLRISIPSLARDSCVDSVTVSDGTRIRPGLDKSSDWLLELDQGVTYNLSVKLMLIDGDGPGVWRGQHTTKRAPGPPMDLSLTDRSENSATFTWTSPHTDVQIQEYQISCRAVNTTYNTGVSSNTVTANSSTPSGNISSLSSQVQYECTVKALVLNGYGEESTSLVFWTKPPELSLKFPFSQPVVFEGSVILSLPDLRPQPTSAYSSMQVVVKNVTFRRKRSLTSLDIDGVHVYITAEIPIAEVNNTFTVGDNQVYGGYTNRHLDVGSYMFYVGFRAKTEDIIEYIEIPESAVSITGPTSATPTDNSGGKSNVGRQPNTGLIVGIVGGLLAVVVVAVIIVLLLRRRRLSDRGVDYTPAVAIIEATDSNDTGRPVGVVEPSSPRHRPPKLPPSGGDTYDNVVKEPSPMNPLPVSDLHRYIAQMKKANTEEPFKEEYQKIGTPALECLIGRQPENVKKNRFKNITATDANRVVLSVTGSYSHETDYVNANYIKDYAGRQSFVAAQGPNDGTIEDFWRTVHDTNSSTIVMLTNPVEATKKKCSVYWAERSGVTQVYGQFEIKLKEEQKFAEYVVRKLQYTLNNKSRDVRQFHFTQWPDHGVPTTAGLLSFRHRVKQDIANSRAPAIIHCSAGVGRTGTFIGLDILIDEGRDRSRRSVATVDVMACVYGMRCQRTQMVQTDEQYMFLYEVLAEALACGDTSVSCAMFTETLEKWRKHKAGQRSTLEEQFNNCRVTSDPAADSNACTALTKENAAKNRDSSVLPLESHRVILQQLGPTATDYINAVFCDSYQMKLGYIITQTPLKDTVEDFWRMIVSKKSPVIVYLNDCQGEAPYWPDTAGSQMKLSHVTVQCVHVSRDHTSGCIETELCCKVGTREQDVTLIQVDVPAAQLPAPADLLTICSKIERFAASGHDTITFQCRNGSRLSGIMVVAMNLFLRARIEQEVDIVLEVKLARRSRPQFIPDLASFDLLYEFVSTFLAEFSDYSNFK